MSVMQMLIQEELGLLEERGRRGRRGRRRYRRR